MPLRVGDVEIGNWNRDARKGPAAVRFLNGAMDEFAIFSASGADELTRLYESGRPPS